MLDLEIKKREIQVLFIGDGESNPGAIYLHGLKECGYNIFHVGKGSKDFDISKIYSKPIMIENDIGTSNVKIKCFKLESLLDILKYKFDLIIHIQDWSFPEGTTSIPYFYYCTEIAYPRVPDPAWYVLCSTDAIKRTVKRDYPRLKGIIYHLGKDRILQGFRMSDEF